MGKTYKDNRNYKFNNEHNRFNRGLSNAIWEGKVHLNSFEDDSNSNYEELAERRELDN